MSLSIASVEYQFMPHPIFANQVHVLEGSESFVYQLRDTAKDEFFALKVMKPSYRGEYLARGAKELFSHQHTPGLNLCYRLCLTRATAPELIVKYPDLEYAVLMPWLQARTWAGLMRDRSAGPGYQPKHACSLVLETVRVLKYLEEHRMAHADIAGSNIFLSPDLVGIRLLDLEGMYYEGGMRPQIVSRGSPGYRHRHLTGNGQWCLAGDRFAGAILVTEMLTWCDPVVRALTPEDAESLFSPEELQTVGSQLWQAVRHTLFRIDGELLSLFDRAWASSVLLECPDFQTWMRCIERVCRMQNMQNISKR